jgi:hypothetical protein
LVSIVVVGCLYPAVDEIPIAYCVGGVEAVEAGREFVTVDPLIVATDGMMKSPLAELVPLASELEDVHPLELLVHT